MELTSIKNITSWVNGSLQGDDRDYFESIKINNISTDSRNIDQGDLYIPIVGEKFDGHNFIIEALEKGAVGCISEKEIQSIPKGKFVITVADTQKALLDISENYLSLFNIPVIGITGSVGKTTTKEMIASVLSQKYNVLKTEGNFNNHIGLPLTVFRLNKEHEVLILEMGMNNFGEIHKLSKVAKPDIAVITNIGYSHIGNLGNQEGILKAKSEIFDFIKENGLAVLNGDDKLLYTLKDTLENNIIFYGQDEKNNYKAVNIESMGLDGTKATVSTEQDSFDIISTALGKHIIYSILPAIAIAKQMGLTTSEIQNGVENFKSTEKRMSLIKTKSDILIINDAYNATVSSVKAGIEVLIELNQNRRKVAILGDMLEMGEYSPKCHAEVGKYVAEKNIDLLFCIGEDAKYIYDAVKQADGKNKIQSYHFQTKELLINKIGDFVKRGDIVFIKASNSLKLWEISDKIQNIELKEGLN